MDYYYFENCVFFGLKKEKEIRKVFDVRNSKCAGYASTSSSLTFAHEYCCATGIL